MKTRPRPTAPGICVSGPVLSPRSRIGEQLGPRTCHCYSRSLPDFWKAIALERVARILGPGGVLVLEDLVYSFEPGEADAAIARWLTAAPDDSAVGWTAAELAEHVREEYSTFTWLLEPMLEWVGFEIRDRWVSETRTYGAYTCVRR